MSSTEWAGYALVLLGLVLMLFSLRPTLRSMGQHRTRRRIEKERAAEQNRKAARDAATRERLIPELAAFDPFCSAAGDMVRHLDNLYYADGSPSEEWKAFNGARYRAMLLAPDLYEPLKTEALELLQPFTKIDQENYTEIRDNFAHLLRDWLQYHRIRYYHERRAVGLPELPQGG